MEDVKVPDEIREILERAVPGRENAAFRYQVREAVKQVLAWNSATTLAVPCVGGHRVKREEAVRAVAAELNKQLAARGRAA